MTALKASEVERFLKRPDLEAGVLLVHGSDAGLIREVGQRLARHYGGDSDSMNLVTLEGGEVDADPARLAMEARTVSLFGDRRVVRVRGAGKGAVIVLSGLLEDPGGAIVILEAGNLTPRDALRALVEGSRNGRALPCYPDTDESLVRLIEEWLRQAGIAADSDVAPTLRDALGNDREVTRRELEKLSFFAANSKVLTRDDVLILCADNAALAIDEVLDAAGTGHAARLNAALERALRGGDAQQILTLAIRHFSTLRRWRTEVDAGRSAREVIANLRPKPHFKRTPALEQQLRTWTDSALGTALERLHLASADSRKRYALSETVVRRALLAVSLMVAEH